MADKTFEVTDNDRNLARTGVEAQAQAMGVDMSVDANVAFVERMVERSASQTAENRFLQNIIHAEHFGT